MSSAGPLSFAQDSATFLSPGESLRPKGRRTSPRDSLPDSTSEALRILVVEDHPMARKTICDLLQFELRFEVVWEAENGLDGVSSAAALQPDVVLLDITMPTLGGIEAAVRIRRVAPKARIIFLSQHNLKKLAQAALATGAHGYVLKSTAGTDLIPAIRAVMAGEKFVSKLGR
jgi:two-component system response regulator NreC